MKSQIGIYEKALPKELSWKEKFTFTKTVGYDYIEISIDETDDKLARLDWSDEEINNLLMLSKEYQMPIKSMCLSGHRKYPLGSHDQKTRNRSLEIMEKACIFADKLGIRTIQLAGYDVYYEDSDEETKKFFLENLKESVAIAAKYGILLGFETMETEFMNTVEKAMHYVHLVNSPYLNVYPDLGNLKNASVLYGTNVLDDIQKGQGHLIAMHLKETVPNVYREVPYGTGHVNFKEGIQTAYQLGVRRFVTEFWYKGSPNWREDVLNAYNLMSNLIEGVEHEN